MEDVTEEIQLERYAAYKDSGVEWLGEIPEHWAIVKAKYLWKEKIQLSINGDETLLSVSQYLGVNNRENESRSESLVGYKKISENDLVINIMLAWLGGLGLSSFKGVVSPAYAVYELTINADPKFLHHLYRTKTYLEEFARRSKGVVPSRWRMYSDDFGQVSTLFPPIEEQSLIAQFLDRKTTQIDKAITQKIRLIELLKERRQILIHHAVTRGLNPDVPMKDSGVEWIGQIPEHWEVKKLKYVSEIFRGKFTHRPRNDERLYDGIYPFFQTGDVARAGKYLFKYQQTLNEKGLRVCTLFPKGTIVITIAANIGDISILNIDACFPDSIVGFEPAKIIEKYFLYNTLLIMKEQFISSTIKNTQMNLNVDRIGSNFISIPPKSEQIAISEYIETASQKIATAISCKQKEIEKLKEYKATLINSAVTGKIKVA